MTWYRSVPAALVLSVAVSTGSSAATCAALSEPVAAQVEAVLPTVASYLESRQTQASIADRSHEAIVKAQDRARGPARVKTKSRLLKDYRRTLELAEAQNRLYARTLRSDVEFVGRLTRLLRNLVGTLRQINTVGCTLQ